MSSMQIRNFKIITCSALRSRPNLTASQRQCSTIHTHQTTTATFIRSPFTSSSSHLSHCYPAILSPSPSTHRFPFNPPIFSLPTHNDSQPSSSSSSPSLFRKYGNVLVLKRFQVRVALTATYVWSVCKIRWSLFVAISTAGPAFTNGLTKLKRSRRKSCNVQYANQKFQNHHLFRSTVAAKPHRLPKAMLN
ncbi:hypothetical protein RYX36_021074, partial [Vicia faba]